MHTLQAGIENSPARVAIDLMSTDIYQKGDKTDHCSTRAKFCSPKTSWFSKGIRNADFDGKSLDH